MDEIAKKFINTYERSLIIYVLALGMIVALMTTSFFIESRILKSQKNFTTIINTSGRQRMLSQRIALYAREMQDANSIVELNLKQEMLREVLTEIKKINLQFLDDGMIELNSSRVDFIRKQNKNLVNEFYNHADWLTNAAAGEKRLREKTISRILYLTSGPILRMFDDLTAAREIKAIEVYNQYKEIKYFLFLSSVVLTLAVGLLMFYPLARKNLNNSLQILELHRSEEKLRKLSELGEAFSSTIHEINNPLSIALLKLHSLQKKADLEQGTKNSLLLIEKNLGRITKIIKSTKAIYRNGDNDPVVPVLLGRVVQEAVDATAILRGKRELSISSHIQQEIVVHAREHQVFQVLLNLIINAIDALDTINDSSGGAKKEISIELLQDEKFSIFRITDSGPGVPFGEEEKIFESLYTTKTHGTGLGLTECRRIMESYQGTIRLNRQISNSCFEVLFPRL